MFAFALLLIVFFATPSRATAPQTPQQESSTSILHVDDDAPPGGDGSTWDTAFTYLQDALAVANAPDSGVTEVRVAEGSYTPDAGAGQTPGDKTATFVVGPGLSIRGGFAGVMGHRPDLHDPDVFRTILSGDLLGNDGPAGSFENYQDNTLRIIHVLGGDELSIVDGFIICGASGLTAFGPPSEVGGGGLYCVAGNISVSNCVFLANKAQWGGGAFLIGSNSEVTRCQFLKNRVAGASNFGGGLYAAGQITDCQFISNRALTAAGGAAGAGGHYVRCFFQDNISGGHGGAIFGSAVDCVFINNFAGEEGGAVHIAAGGPIINCTFEGNGANAGGAVRGIATIIGSRFVNNKTYGHAGSAFWGGGTIINCEFIANKALNSSAGGAVAACTPTPGPLQCAPLDVINCVFHSNFSHTLAGAAWVQSPQTATFTNCTFTDNVSLGDNGGAVSVNNLNNPPGVAIVRNSIAWNNFPGDFEGPVDAQFSCVTNGWPGAGNIARDPLFVDRLGRDGIAGTGDEDFRLSAASPGIDAGDNTALPPDTRDLDGDGDVNESLPIDFNGNLRRVNDPRMPNTGWPPGAQVMVDMGAFEFADFRPLAGDIAPFPGGDGVVNVNDLLAVINSWGPCPPPPSPCPTDLNQDGVVNHLDLLFVLQHWG